jgi:spore coat protein U-like protein
MYYLKSYLAIAAILCLASTFVAVNVGSAATATGSLAVSGSVGASCSVGTSSLNFGALTSGVALSGSGTISVTCTSGAVYSVDLDAGLIHLAGSDRILYNGNGLGSANIGNFLSYDLYQDAGHTLLWGSGLSGGSAKAGTGTGAAQNIPVYGNIPAQPVNPGSFTDTVGVTVTF